MLKKIINKKQGFTLIELIVVVAIIGILSGVVMVAVGDAAARARNSRRLADVRQLSFVLEREAALGNIVDLTGCVGTTYATTTVCGPTPTTVALYFRNIFDPAGRTLAACTSTPFVACQYSIRRESSATTSRTNDYAICFWIEPPGTIDFSAGAHSIRTGGRIVSGCP